MKLEAIAQWLQDRGVGVVGQTIFINFIPDNISGILLRPDLGGTKVDNELPGYVRSPFWVIARSPNFQQAGELSDLVKNAFREISGQEVGGVKFKWVKPIRYPFPYAPSPGQNVELATLYLTAHVDTTY